MLLYYRRYWRSIRRITGEFLLGHSSTRKFENELSKATDLPQCKALPWMELSP